MKLNKQYNQPFYPYFITLYLWFGKAYIDTYFPCMVKVMFIKASRLYVEHATDFRIWAFMPIEIKLLFHGIKENVY